MAQKHMEIAPLLMPSALGLTLGPFMLASKIIVLGVDFAGDEELSQAWYLNQQSLPIIRHVKAFAGLVGVLAFTAITLLVVPRALAGRFTPIMGVLKCAPVFLIACLVHVEVKANSIIGPGVPSLDLLKDVAWHRWATFGINATALLIQILSWRVQTWGVIGGLRHHPNGEKPIQAVVVSGVPDDVDIQPWTRPRVVELVAILCLFGFCAHDLGIALQGDEVLCRKWLERRDALPIVRQTFLFIGAVSCWSFVAAVMYRLPGALRGEPGMRAGCATLVVSPLMVLIWHCADEATMQKETAIAKVVLIAVGVSAHLAELAARNDGLKCGVRSVMDGHQDTRLKKD